MFDEELKMVLKSTYSKWTVTLDCCDFCPIQGGESIKGEGDQ